MTSYGDASHLLDGHCINDHCSCGRVLFIWEGDAQIKAQMLTHLKRISDDSTASGLSGQLELAAMLGTADFFAFAQDEIFAMRRQASPRHLYALRRFLGLVLWVSVLPHVANAPTLVFPSGYGAFLDRICDESGWNQGGTVVAHWIALYSREQWLINLAAIGDKNHIKPANNPRGFLLLPLECISESERVQFNIGSAL
jgi:hypothetical protein